MSSVANVPTPCRCGRKLRQCPACRFPSARNLGHCKRSKKVLNCRKGPGGQVQAFAFARAAEDVFADTAFEDSGIVRGRCPILPSAAEPGHFEELLAESELDEEPDYTESDYEYNIVLDGNSYQYYGDGDYEIRPPEFVAVATPAEFQAALRVGAFHILVKEHLDMTDAPTEPDLIGLEGLNSAVGRVLNTTRSIVVRTPRNLCLHCDRPCVFRRVLVDAVPAWKVGQSRSSSPPTLQLCICDCPIDDCNSFTQTALAAGHCWEQLSLQDTSENVLI